MIQWIIFSEERAGRPRECPNKQSAKGATFALLATMLRGRFQESMEPCSRYYAPWPFSGEHGTLLPQKEISFCEDFWSGTPSKIVISENQTDLKMPTKPYAAKLSTVFKT